MGIAPDAELIWGVVIRSDQQVTYDAGPDEGTITEDLYNEEEGWNEDLIEDTRLEFVQVGHYEDPEPFAVLTHKDATRYRADAWTPKVIEPWELQGGTFAREFDAPVSDKQVIKAADEAVSLGLPDLRGGRWLLVAGLG